MIFPSLSFLVFAALFFSAWPLVRRHGRARQVYLLLASLGFYGWTDPRMLLAFLPTGVGVYLLALALERSGRRKSLFVLSVVLVLSELIWFRCGRSLGAAAALLRGALTGSADSGVPAWPGPSFFPLGLSFYTFQSLAVLIDVYRGRTPACRDPLLFLCAFSFFPNVVAGPIVRPGQILPQLASPAPPGEEQRAAGLRLIVAGYFKKSLIADNLVLDIARAFAGAAGAHGSVFWWSIAAAYTAQIYFDFSGYSDIARGLARWMGIRLPVNFNHPYHAKSVSAFWSRWHMTLSLWFRDYVFLPVSYALSRRIARDRVAGIKAELWIYSLATLATMTLCGFWHGAAWTFVVWGAAHGAFLCVERATRWPKIVARLPGGGALAVLLVLLQVGSAWILFRAESFSQAGAILGRLYSFRGGWEWGLTAGATVALALGILLEARGVFRSLAQMAAARPALRWADPGRTRILEPAALALLILAVLLFRGPGSAFVYFRF